jgi:hypothetical protein
MATKPVRKGVKGRPKGSKNLVNDNARANIITVFREMGGIHRMVAWAQENPTEFYKIYARLIPQEVVGNPESPIVHTYRAQREELLAEYYERLAKAHELPPAADPRVVATVGRPGQEGNGPREDEEPGGR